MDEPRDPIIEEESRPAPQDVATMTRTVVTCGDIHGAEKTADQSLELVENLRNLYARTSLDGTLDEKELPNDPCKIDIETSSVGPCISSMDSCVIIPEEKTADHSLQLVVNLHNLDARTSHDRTLDEKELLNDPCKIDIESSSVGPCISSMDSCVTIPEEDATVEHGRSPAIGTVDSCYDLSRTFSASGGSQVGDDEDEEPTLEGNVAKELAESFKPLLEEDPHERECPICTELYDTTKHKQSLLNCNHVLCDSCIKTMVNTANRANLCRVTCPICRQTTPMFELEVLKMQEQMMESVGVCGAQQDYVPPQPLVRRPGLCGALEYRFHNRFRTGRLFLFPPCIRNPQRIMSGMAGLERRCRCLYLVALVFLLFAEFFCFTFLFLPILVFILMIVLGK